MENAYKIFRESIKEVTRYYMLLVEETKSQRLVGSTNEWVLDNYYMISEQEKVLRGELKGVVSGKGRLTGRRIETLWKLLEAYLRRCHHHVDKNLLFRYLSQVQVSQKDYLTYPEVCALLPLTKTILIKELADLCRQLEASNAYHYSPTDNKQADRAHLDKAAQQNLQMMNIFNSLKKMTKLPIAELLDADMLVILTAVEKVAINFGKPDQKGLDDLTPADARKYIEEKQFAPGSMLPKVQAALSFAESKPGRVALITLLEKAADGISGKTGTRVHQ